MAIKAGKETWSVNVNIPIGLAEAEDRWSYAQWRKVTQKKQEDPKLVNAGQLSTAPS